MPVISTTRTSILRVARARGKGAVRRAFAVARLDDATDPRRDVHFSDTARAGERGGREGGGRVRRAPELVALLVPPRELLKHVWRARPELARARVAARGLRARGPPSRQFARWGSVGRIEPTRRKSGGFRFAGKKNPSPPEIFSGRADASSRATPRTTVREIAAHVPSETVSPLSILDDGAELHTRASSYTVPRSYARSLPSHHRSVYRPSASLPLALPSSPRFLRSLTPPSSTTS